MVPGKKKGKAVGPRQKGLPALLGFGRAGRKKGCSPSGDSPHPFRRPPNNNPLPPAGAGERPRSRSDYLKGATDECTFSDRPGSPVGGVGGCLSRPVGR